MTIRLSDLDFTLMISEADIQFRVKQLGKQLSSDFQGRTPLLVGILNGSFVFLADLVRAMDTPVEIAFSRLSSYEGGINSTGIIKEQLSVPVPLHNRHVVIVEDIVDSGQTLSYLIGKLQEARPASLSVCTLLLKPDAVKYPLPGLKYTGFEIENHFVVGYGMDYRELGRNLRDVYRAGRPAG